MSINEASAPQPYIPALRRLYAPLAPYAFTLVRFCAGVLIARHGYPKLFEGGAAGLAGGAILPTLGFTPALLWAYIIGCTEVFGGILLAIGFLTRFAAAALVIEFAVIVFEVKWANGLFAFTPKAIQPGFPGLTAGGFELEMILGLICLAALIGGGGKGSVDRAIGREI